MCMAVKETTENVRKTRGWGCASDTRCGWKLPGATGKDRDKLLLYFYKSFNKLNPDDILYNSQMAGHASYNDYDYCTIEYEAGMLALFMTKNWKYLLDSDFCCAYEQAKSLGFNIPTNANKAYWKRKKRDRCGKYRRVRSFSFKKRR